jgi:hypothetical protein
MPIYRSAAGPDWFSFTMVRNAKNVAGQGSTSGCTRSLSAAPVAGVGWSELGNRHIRIFFDLRIHDGIMRIWPGEFAFLKSLPLPNQQATTDCSGLGRVTPKICLPVRQRKIAE